MTAAELIPTGLFEGDPDGGATLQDRSKDDQLASEQRRRLFGRVEDRSVLDELVELVREGFSGSLVLAGEPGIGKTRLLDHVADVAADLVVLRTAGVESEMGLGFAALHRLLAPVVDRVEGLPAPQREALGSTFGLAVGAPPDRFLVGLATLTLLADVAAERPLVCAVDDAQWLDTESLAVLGFVARRLHADGIVVVFGLRDGEPSPPALDGLPARRLAGLAASDARELLASRVAGGLDGRVSERLTVETGGNPLALIQLARGLTAKQLAGRASLPAPLPVGRRLEALFLRRVEALPADTRLLLLVAAAEPPRNAGVLWRAAALLGITSRAADPAVSAGILSGHPYLDFDHPLIRSAVYSGAAADERRRVHGVLAAALDQDQDRDRRAWHLAAAAVEPDEDVAAELERGAERARGRGGYSAQASYLLRAAELTPDPVARTGRLFASASAHLVAGAPGAAQALLNQAVPELTAPLVRAQAQQLRAAIEQGFERMPTVPSILLDAASTVDQYDRQLAREMLFDALQAALITREHTVGITPLDIAQSALAAPRCTEGEATVPDLLLDGFATRIAKNYAAAVPLLREAIEALRIDELVESGMPLAVMVMWTTNELWDDRGCRRVLERLDRSDRDQGALFALRTTLLGLANCEMLTGRFASAEALNAEFAEISAAIGLPSERSAHSAELLAWQGREEEARHAASSAIHQVGEQRGIAIVASRGLIALTLLELSLSHYHEALGWARQLYLDDLPGVGNDCLVDLIEAGSRADDRNVANAALARLAERAPVSGTAWALGQLARGRALLADDAAAEVLYRESIEHLEATDLAPELARSHLVYGEWLRHQRRRADAGRELRIAYDAFVRMGAARFAERARAELLANGGRAARRTAPPDLGLTPQEAQIARLVTEGATNAEIATRLFITASTVEYHLHKIFRKLDLTSRRQVAQALRDQPPNNFGSRR